VTCATSVPILVFLGLSVLDLGPMYATDRQIDVRQHHFLGGGHNRRTRIEHVHCRQFSTDFRKKLSSVIDTRRRVTLLGLYTVLHGTVSVEYWTYICSLKSVEP